MGFIPQTSGTGLFPGVSGIVAVPTYQTGNAQGRAGVGTAGSTIVDPLGLGYVYGPAIPMSPAQTGLFMLSAQQRLLGIGNGQISGTRPGGETDSRSSRNRRASTTQTAGNMTAAHTRNSNIPGGQAARFFNRGPAATAGVTGNPHAYYKRQMRYFPQTTQ
jgi:hypothetical protein